MYWFFGETRAACASEVAIDVNALWDLVGGLESGISVHCLHAAALTVPDARLPKHILMDDSGCLRQLQAVAPDDDAALLKCLDQNHYPLGVA
jgi:hypothetical protein